MRISGVVAPLALPGAVDRTVFQALVPELPPGDVVVWDRLQPHQNPAVIVAVGARVELLPVYSPDLTPIEKMCSATKDYVRIEASRATERVITAMGKALARGT